MVSYVYFLLASIVWIFTRDGCFGESPG